MAIFTEVFQSKDLLIASVLQSFYIVSSFESNKFTAKKSSTKIFRVHLLFASLHTCFPQRDVTQDLAVIWINSSWCLITCFWAVCFHSFNPPKCSLRSLPLFCSLARGNNRCLLKISSNCRGKYIPISFSKAWISALKTLQSNKSITRKNHQLGRGYVCK